MRLDHFLALASVGTKKKIREYIYAGFITVNNQICCVPATIIDPKTDFVSYQNTRLTTNPVYYILNKPQGCLTAKEQHIPTVFDCLSGINTTGLFAVGRLDKDTEGILILTNDGNFSNQLMAPDHHITKTYQFLALGTLSESDINRIEVGMDIGNAIFTKPAQIRILKKGLYSDLSREIGIEKMKKIKRQPEGQPAFLGELIISEGKKHQVKRMLRGVNCPVIYLKRTAIGRITLPATLKSGCFIQVTKERLTL